MTLTRKAGVTINLILLAITFLALIFEISKLTGSKLWLESLFLAGFAVLSIQAMIKYSKNRDGLLIFSYITAFLNSIILWMINGFTVVALLITIITPLIGLFFTSIPTTKRRKRKTKSSKEGEEDIPHSVVFTEETPEKFIASESSKYYHNQDCQWSERIEDNRKLVFNNEKQAKEAGYDAHSCIKE